MSPPDGDNPLLDLDLDEVARRIEAEARAAYQQFLELVDRGVAPRDAISRVKGGFEASYYEELSRAFDRIAAEPWTIRELRKYPVSGVSLSRRMYQHWQDTGRRVTTIVNRHAKGVQQARDLARQLYDGYGHRRREALDLLSRPRELPAPLRELVAEPAVRQVLRLEQARAAAVRLRTAALRSAYLQAFDAALDGAARARLERALQVAMEEKTRYFANRIAQTELARAHANRMAREFMADSTLEVVQWRMSASHPEYDICDVFANVNRYGLGPGVYPKRLAPKPVAHPFCRCRLRSRPDLNGVRWSEVTGAEAAYLRRFGDRNAVKLMGSRQRLESVLNGQEARAAWNRGRPAEYHVIPLEQYRPTARLARTKTARPPAVPRPPAPPPPAPRVAGRPVSIDDFIAAGRKITADLPDGAREPLAFVSALVKRMKDAGLAGHACQVVGRTPAAKLVQQASRYYPRAWNAAADALGSLFVRGRTGGRGWEWTAPVDRAIVRLQGFGILRDVKKGTGFMMVPTGDLGVAIHEFGHRLQAAMPGLDRIFQDLHARRTAGQPLELLRNVTRSRGYAANEVTRKDGYTEPYQGKEYAGRGALEVLTIAFENVLALAGGPAASHGAAERRLREFYKKDREMLDLTVGLLLHYTP